MMHGNGFLNVELWKHFFSDHSYDKDKKEL